MQTAKSIVINCTDIGAGLGLGINKALLKIDGRSLISLQLELFKNIQDVRVVVGYQANDVIEEALKYRSDVVFVYNHNYFDTQTGAGFYLGARHANERIVAYDGGLLVHPDDMKRCLDTEGEYLAYSDIMSDGTIFVTADDQSNVLNFSLRNGDFAWTGPVCINKNKLNPASENGYTELEKHLPMHGIRIRACFIETYADYQRAVELARAWRHGQSSI